MVMVRQRARVGCLAMALALTLAFSAHAVPGDSSTCHTRTEREVPQIIVPFGDAEHPELPAQAVKIVPGETLCLVGDRDEAGELINLQLAAETNAVTTDFVELKLERGDVTRLAVRHSSKSWLYYGIYALITQQDVAVPVRVLAVPGDQTALESWSPNVRKLMLYGFRLGAPPTPMRPDDARPRRKLTGLNASVTFGLWGGERSLHLPELDQALARDGFAPLQHVGIVGGLDMDFTIGRVRAGVGFGTGARTTHHRTTGEELSTRHSDVLFTVGFDVLRYEPFRVFLGSGLGVASLYVDRRDGSTLFPDAKPWEGDRVDFTAFEVPFELGTDYFVPFGPVRGSERWLVQFGARVGWQQQVGSGVWKTDDKGGRELAGPAVDLSGPRARLMLGIGAQNGW
jgi:hypothetical protein